MAHNVQGPHTPIKLCRSCHRYKPAYAFPKDRTRSDGLGYVCKMCRNSSRRKGTRALKVLAVEYKGGKCEVCGLFTDIVDVYDFHHVSDSGKESTISKLLWGCNRDTLSDDVKVELDKTLLVCANCHRIIHAELLG